MSLHDMETWLEDNGTLKVELVDNDTYHVLWMPANSRCGWSRYRDNYTEAIEAMYDDIKTGLFQKVNGQRWIFLTKKNGWRIMEG